MKKPFQVGDRVRLIGFGASGGETVTVENVLATIRSVDSKLLHVRCDSQSWDVSVFHSQVKSRLVKKPSRRVWIAEAGIADLTETRHPSSGGTIWKLDPGPGYIEFREVRKPKESK